MPKTRVFYVENYHQASSQGYEVVNFISDMYGRSAFAIVVPSEMTKEARVLFSPFGIQKIRIAYNVPNSRAVDFKKLIAPMKVHLAQRRCQVELVDGSQLTTNTLSWYNHLLVTAETEFPVSEIEQFFEKF